MSYDVSVGGEWFNYTGNMHQFFKDFNCYPPHFHEVEAGRAAELLDAGLKDIVLQKVSYLREYDASNGWGDWQSATRFLMEVRDACMSAPHDELLNVSW